ncbi:putative cell cycle sequence binding phosphoprotein (RBP45) [Trypanosoma theileri]|uniref:Putative cell cycle sequence binding phosphoprotein (RBP45) n=1 Tax=Trypanosoma theileri TaxID=67003 RepID=A0A1X0NWX9_9TRYP|nr:putative cell cycle sequence binding phosphoprotein (RBP45) [Trypanosoma theileri]ORC88610.1 putative cell cycle sequence binding phosphoprotein (RBP45) [Trypanosoma theileri]
MNVALLKDIEETRRYIDECYLQDLGRLEAARSMFEQHFSRLDSLIRDSTNPRHDEGGEIRVDTLLATPCRQTYNSDDKILATPSMASPPISRGTINYDRFLDEVTCGALASTWPNRLNNETDADTRKRPTLESIPEGARNRSPPKDHSAPCQVLVVFKRKRILQFESPTYVSPGEYVVVGGDRGEDIGLVTHSRTLGEHNYDGEKKWAEGVGRVLRVATALEVSQLQGVQTELEERAVEVAQKKVEEHRLPMCIVDAEYQFDRKKLTFYYRSQQRLDFRTLVRDLYKTFRARIWMEPEVPS